MSEGTFGAIFASTYMSDKRFRSYFAQKDFLKVFFLQQKILGSNRPAADRTTRFFAEEKELQTTLHERADGARIPPE